MILSRASSLRSALSSAASRSMFTSSRPDMGHPNWVRVGLAFGTSAFLWVLLFKQHSSDVAEYKARNHLEP